MTRLAVQYEGDPQITEVFPKTGDVFNIFPLVRSDGVTKQMTFKALLDIARRSNFTDHDKVGEITYETPAVGVVPTYGTLQQATFIPTGSTRFEIPIISADPAPTEYPNLPAERWRTMISRLPAGVKTTLRTAIQDGLAIDPADPADDAAEAVYLGEMKKRVAAQWLISLDHDFGHTSTLAALAVIGLPLSGTQLDGFNTRWLQTYALS